MKDKLLELANNSYAPYSNFRVSAILITKDNKAYTGVNIENAAYPSGICAERTAIFKAISNGEKKGNFKELNIMCADDEKIGTPCFACRQVMLEFFDENTIIRCFSKTGEYKEYTLSELCPYPFDSSDLNK